MTYGKNMTVIKRKIERSVIRSAAFLTYDQVREQALAQGMSTLRQEAVRLVTEGVTTVAEVVRSIYVL